MREAQKQVKRPPCSVWMCGRVVRVVVVGRGVMMMAHNEAPFAWCGQSQVSGLAPRPGKCSHGRRNAAVLPWTCHGPVVFTARAAQSRRVRRSVALVAACAAAAPQHLPLHPPPAVGVQQHQHEDTHTNTHPSPPAHIGTALSTTAAPERQRPSRARRQTAAGSSRSASSYICSGGSWATSPSDRRKKRSRGRAGSRRPTATMKAHCSSDAAASQHRGRCAALSASSGPLIAQVRRWLALLWSSCAVGPCSQLLRR